MRVAVCICTAGRPEALRRLLGHLETADLQPPGATDVRLVVVDNRPDGRTPAIIKRARSRLPVPIELVESSPPGISAARNKAVEVALALRAAFVAFIDDDDLPQPDWLAALLEEQARAGSDMVFGTWRHPPDIAVPAWLRRSAYLQPARLDRLSRHFIPSGASTCNVLLSARLLQRLGAGGGPFRAGFAATGGGDTDLFIRAAAAGFTFSVAARSEVVLHWEANRLGWRGLMRRRFRYGVTRHALAVAHGPAATPWRRRRRALRKLGHSLVRLPTRAISGDDAATALLALAEDAGEVHAAFGRSFAYYHRPRGPQGVVAAPADPHGR